MSRADDDETFGFDKLVDYEDSAPLNVRRWSGSKPDVVIDSYDGETYIKLTLDEAEALAYRLLYAVNRIKEDADGQA